MQEVPAFSPALKKKKRVAPTLQNRTRHIRPTFDARAIEAKGEAERNLPDAMVPVCDGATLPPRGFDHSVNYLSLEILNLPSTHLYSIRL